eukprot:COSAG06_NODE_17928_length_914_cov_0.770552_1_plen_33_part_10
MDYLDEPGLASTCLRLDYADSQGVLPLPATACR